MKVSYNWEPLYKAAMLETEVGELPKRIEAAKAALDLRKMELGGSDLKERLAIGDAIHSLELLRAERSGLQAADASKL
jgi:hypothetical protein